MRAARLRQWRRGSREEAADHAPARRPRGAASALVAVRALVSLHGGAAADLGGGWRPGAPRPNSSREARVGDAASPDRCTGRAGRSMRRVRGQDDRPNHQLPDSLLRALAQLDAHAPQDRRRPRGGGAQGLRLEQDGACTPREPAGAHPRGQRAAHGGAAHRLPWLLASRRRQRQLGVACGPTRGEERRPEPRRLARQVRSR